MKYQIMKKLGYSLLIICGLLTACSTSKRSAPVTERSGQSRVVAGQGYYVVQKGDTLNQIAKRHGQSTANVTAWNNLDNPNNIKVGQVLRVSATAAPVTPVASATDGAQTASVASTSSVEVRPLSQDGATTKTAPSGSKKPYSETATPSAATTQGDVTGTEQNQVVWAWPAPGKILVGFQESKNKGIDIAGKKGDKVLSAADGKVTFSKLMKGYGNLVIIKHTDDWVSVYAHNDSVMVQQGQSVTRGQQIAKMGDLDADSARLHFEIRRQGKTVDPTQYLPAR